MLILKCSVSTVWNIVHGKENTEKYTKVPHRRVEPKLLGHYVVVLVSALLLTDSQMWTLVVETYTLSEQSTLHTAHWRHHIKHYIISTANWMLHTEFWALYVFQWTLWEPCLPICALMNMGKTKPCGIDIVCTPYVISIRILKTDNIRLS